MTVREALSTLQHKGLGKRESEELQKNHQQQESNSFLIQDTEITLKKD